MAKFPIMPLFTDAILSDTIHLSDAETGSYLTLLMAAWRSDGCRLKDDNTQLARAARCSMRVWMSSRRSVMEQFFTVENGYWTQKRQLQERAKVEDRSALASKKSKTRWEAKSLEKNDTDDAGAMPGQSYPLTVNESTIVDSPPIVPQPEPVSPLAQSAVADVFLDPEPQFELMVPTEANISIASVPVVYGQKSKSPAKRHVYGPEFEEFWAIYPRKANKHAAEKAWKKAMEVIDPVTLMGRLRMLMPQFSDDHDFIPHPASWLNGRRWEDGIRPPKPNKTASAVSLSGLMARIHERNLKDREYDDEAACELGALPALPWPDGYEDPTPQRNRREH